VSRELLILRHGKSDWGASFRDYDRPLKNRGKRSAQKMGVWLWQQDLRPQLIISSPAERAITTAHKCAKAMGMPVRYVICDERIYEASLDELLEVLADAPVDVNRIMLVGHNPGLEELLIFLADGAVPFFEDEKLLPTATLAHLEMPDDWSDLGTGCAGLRKIVRPRSLPDGFPYPGPDGEELRERPAYYYTQSAVIPYRLLDSGKSEFLLISSSSNKHWVVPKGIKDPGLSPEESAAKEAWEEAGIKGKIDNELLGSYTVMKWGASCTVDVFAMQVDKIVEEDDWEERHRQRRWFSPQQAADSLKQPELARMLVDLAERIGS
jgi:phosphohistidine phosphatase